LPPGELGAPWAAAQTIAAVTRSVTDLLIYILALQLAGIIPCPRALATRASNFSIGLRAGRCDILRRLNIEDSEIEKQY
jgi:hypothetical protein